MINIVDPVPIVLQGEGHYAVTDVKDIKVTKDYERTKCQTSEYRADCLTRKHREQVLANCHCAPFYMRSYYGDQVGCLVVPNIAQFYSHHLDSD